MVKAVAPEPAADTKPIPAEQFQILHALIKPHPGEAKWAQIPWLTSLTFIGPRAI
jgi:hypothetical protein